MLGSLKHHLCIMLKFARPLGVLDHLKLSFFQFLSFQLSFLQLSTLFLSTFWSRAGRPWDPNSEKSIPGGTGWADFEPLGRTSVRFFRFLSLQKGIKNSCIFCIAPKGQQIDNEWPKVDSRAILGTIFMDFGSHFGIYFPMFLSIDFASIFH